MDDCIFCKIIAGKLPADIVYQDDRVVAFWDAHPSAPIHILIVPREHIATLNDIPEDSDILSHLGRIAKEIARQQGVDQSGYRFFINVNKGGGQVIFHLHAHIMAGNDIGMSLVMAAVGVSVIWRKFVRLVTGRRH
jgi:histidine triad (HIT) family protein